MKKILLIICAFCCLILNAQLDTDHWFAPMAAKAGTSNLQSYLYLSTNETIPFTVQVYNNNTVYTTVSVSKNNPAQISIPENFMFATNQADLFIPNSMGLFVKGSKKFFANFRFSVSNHAEIITSKGLAGLGTQFHATMAPLTGINYYINSMIGITATEDNTNVVVSNYNPNVIFSDGSMSATKTVTLNRGQSYIIDAVSSDAQENLDGLIGAKIQSNKPISVTNGNFNGIYTPNNSTNNDILMDQAVPIDKLGKEFALVKGNGSITTGMESAIIVATENNTTFSINGVASGITLNAGQFFKLPINYYINQGNGMYNMGISATKNVYLYQLLAGASSGTEFATGGFNFIPPLSCFMPNKIDEIASINTIGTNTYNAKLNIITQQGAVVTLNGNNLPATAGPYPVPGNANWVTYSVSNISGNVTINSTKSVTAGIAAGSGAVGYGGYFAGFSSVPAITKTGDCYSGILLQVDSSYDAYQWFLNGVAISGATSYFINPELYGAGSYTCSVTKNNCETKVTAPYNYTLCPPITTTTYTIGSCNTKVITPTFTNSTQTIVPTLTAIISQPTSGNAIVNPTNGQITYTPNAGITTNTSDSFIYYIQGNGNPFDFEYFKVIINIDALQVNNVSLSSCSNASGNGTYDLTSTIISSNSGTTVTYFANSNLTGQITSPTTYTGPAGIIYANVTSSFGCSKVAQINLTVNPSPNINTTNYNANLCDDNFDGIINVNFSSVTPQIVTNSTNFTVRYYLNQTDANAGNNSTLPINWTYTTNTTVYVRVDGSNSLCPAVFGQINFTIGSKISLLTNAINTQICDNDLNGSENINLNDYKNQFTTDPSVSLTFHSSLANAQAGINALAINQNITSPTTFYIRFISGNACPNTGSIILNLKSPKKSYVLKDQVICSNSKAVLNAGDGFTSYQWSTGATTPSITVGIGNYYVDLTFNGCTYRQNVNVTAAEAPTITSIIVTGTTATINVTGGTTPYQYSLDGTDYQSSNAFTGLIRGPHKVYVLGKDRCDAVVKDFLVLNLINTITPNGDGMNDVLDYSDLKIKEQVSIEVVDRYGAAVYKSSGNNYRWDGMLGGRKLSTGTYWYILKWIEPDTKLPVSYSGWLLIKNRE